MHTGLKKCFFRILREDSGVSAIEFALLAPIFLAALLGMLSAGVMMYQKAGLNSAMQSAAHYVMAGGRDYAVMEQVVRAGDGVQPGATVTTMNVCRCGDTTSACSTLCADDSAPRSYAQISISQTLTPSFFGTDTISTDIEVPIR